MERVAARRVWKRSWQPLLLGSAAVTASAFAHKFLPVPYVWLGAIWTAICFSGIALLARPWSRPSLLMLINGGCLAAMFAITEADFYRNLGEPVYSEGYRTADDVLGFVPVKGTVARSSKTERGRMLYDVTYTIGPDGLRVGPRIADNPLSACVVFFGDSFTFGEGLQDAETLPYQVALQSEGRIRTFNLGFHGYGPHQMLAAIEHGIVPGVVNCRPHFAIYEALPDHAARVAGKVPYGRHTPRFGLAPTGHILSLGHFDDAPSLAERVSVHLEKSAMYRWLENVARPAVTEDDVRLMLGVIRQSRDTLISQYPGLMFHVILWINQPEDEKIYAELRQGMRDADIPVHLVERILPDYHPGQSRYVLSGIDRHPSALTNQLLAAYVIRTIVKN